MTYNVFGGTLSLTQSIRLKAICRAIRIRMANTVGEGVAQSRHFGWQPVLELTCDQVHCASSK